MASLVLLLAVAAWAYAGSSLAGPAGAGRTTGASCSGEEGSCPAADKRHTLPPTAPPITAAVLADDGVRLYLSYALPSRTRSAQLRTASPIVAAALAPLPVDGKAGRDNGEYPMILVLLTFNGETAWFRSRGSPNVPLQSMGTLPVSVTGKKVGRKVTAVAFSSPSDGISDSAGPVLVLGHQSGGASVWRHREEPDGEKSWHQMETVSGAHHNWESVSHVAISADGLILLACTADNVVLWRLSSPGSSTQPPEELHHLHGGDWQVSAARVAMLDASDATSSCGSYLVVVAFASGTIEGWSVAADEAKEDKVVILWRLGDPSLPRAVAIAVSPTRLAMTSSDGEVRIWALGPADAPPKQLWSVRPSRHGLSATALSLLDGGAWIAAGFGGFCAMIDGVSGKEVYRSTVNGSPLAFA